MIKIRTLKEFYCILDMIMSSVTSDMEYIVDVVFTGRILRGGTDSYERIAVPESNCKISITMKEEQLRVISTTNKAIVDWVSEFNTKSYRNTCSCMPFLDSIEELYILDIKMNGEDITEQFNNNGIINMYNLMKFCVDNTAYNNIRVNITDGVKPMTFIYLDGVFTRFVKYNGKNTLYVNKGETVNTKFRDYTLVDFMYCNGIPDVTSQIGMYKNMSESGDVEFSYVVN